MKFKLTPYGRREIVMAALAVTALLAILFVGSATICRHIAMLMVLPLAAWAFVLWFFRDPQRSAPPGEGLFVSPADGRVSDITQIGADSPLGREGVKIGVFMSVFSVHVNRSPFDGRIDRVDHHAGSFLDVRKPEAFERNESATIYMTVKSGGREFPVVFRQIAGLIARRIVTDLAPGQQVLRGQRIGMIKFGSRVELLVPRELAAQTPVKVGDSALAGQTVLVIAGKEPS